MPTEDRRALRDLRRTRKQRRLGDTEWFDVAYRVYLFALGGMIALVFASDAVAGVLGDDVSTADMLRRGPSVAGLAVVVALGLGLRSGADGGPVSVEIADIVHLLLAPIDRRAALLRPVAQRIRASMFALAVPAGVLGQFVAREVVGSRAAWAGAGVLFGAVVGATYATSAVLAHALRLPRWAATGIAALMLVWQGAAAWSTWVDPADRAEWMTKLRHGPADLAGSLAFWGVRQRAIDVIVIVVVIAAIGAALALCGRLRIEPLARRGALVTQLRFAATVQDLRTVVLLRRQLRAEALRSKPWFGRRRTDVWDRPSARHAPPRWGAQNIMIWRRGVRSLRRLPASRLMRIATLSVLAGVFGSLAVSASLLFLVGVLGALFLVGMEAIEPLSQEIDRPDITDSLPVDRGVLFANHLAAPAALLAVAALIAAAAAALVEPRHGLGALAIAIPCFWTGALGPVVGAVRDAPSPMKTADTTLMGSPRNQETSLVPPEFAGFSNAVTTLLPVIVSAAGLLPVVAMRALPSAGTAARTSLFAVLIIVTAITWVRRRDRWGVGIRGFFEAGQQQKAAST